MLPSMHILTDFALQKWEKDDYRLVRFIETPKQVNPEFAIDLIAKVPPEAKAKRVVSCDGGGGPTGHPKVFINLVGSPADCSAVLEILSGKLIS